MRIRTDNILICILWVVAVTLATSFWFNTAFGFNIFSAAHWEYIASLQAAQTPVKNGFYVSIAVTIFITILGLYMVLRPCTRRIRLPIMRVSKNTHEKNNIEKVAHELPDNDASVLEIPATETHPAQMSPQSETMAPSTSARPPRLMPSALGNQYSAPPRATHTATQNAPIGTTPVIQTTPTKTENWPELREIFTNAGYVIKPSPRVNGIQIALTAIGTEQTIWIGCVGVKTTDVHNIVEKFRGIFTDTLDETYIDINAFAITAPDADTSEFQDILKFNSMGELREYMEQNPNPPIPPDDDGMFDAYSQYIDAVITHMGKM